MQKVRFYIYLFFTKATCKITVYIVRSFTVLFIIPYIIIFSFRGRFPYFQTDHPSVLIIWTINMFLSLYLNIEKLRSNFKNTILICYVRNFLFTNIAIAVLLSFTLLKESRLIYDFKSY